MRGYACALVGGQYGSEGKGAIVRAIANEFGSHVRVGGPNAGHSFFYSGKLQKMQQLPCGWVNPTARLYIGAGGLVAPEILLHEIETASHALLDDMHGRVFIDPNALILDVKYHQEEGGTGGELHKRIGSTGEGVGVARIARMRRDPSTARLARNIRPGEYVLISEQLGELDLYEMVALAGVGPMLHDDMMNGTNVLLEGTQGAGLSLIHGPWPYVTTSDIGAAQLLSEVGLPPGCCERIIVVFRSYVIRVAGNSGPMYAETSWEDVSRTVGRSIEERTTVTNKVRRVGLWDWQLFKDAIQRNGPTELAATFVDYVSPVDRGVHRFEELHSLAHRFIDSLETAGGVAVRYVGTGPGKDRSGHDDFVVIDRWGAGGLYA